MTSVSGFWSYTHVDNAAEGGRIARLADLIKGQYQVLTGEQLNLFVDKDNILWGQEWEKVLDGALIETTFLIPIITPSYLLSAACRKEVLAFSGKARSLGVEEFLLPILYVAPRSFEDEESNDEIVALIKKTQWVDWRELRLVDEDSSVHRQAVSRVAARIADIVEHATASPLPVPVQVGAADDDGRPGMLDIMGQAETVIPSWGANIVTLGQTVAEIDVITRDAVGGITQSDSDGGGAIGRLAVVQEYATKLAPYAQIVDDLGASFAAGAVEVDAGISVMLQMTVDGFYQLSEREELNKFFSILEDVGVQAKESIDVLGGYASSLEAWPGLSRDLRKPSLQIKHGLQLFRDGLSVFEGWSAKIDEIRKSPRWNSPSEE